jgi:uncharacterized protein (TIGR00297 family)
MSIPAAIAPLWPTWVIAIGLNTALLTLAWLLPKKLLTPAGYVHAWGLGVLVWGCLGWQGYGVVMVYFLAGSSVTRLGLAQKEAAGIAEQRSGARGPENVWGSALVGALCGVAIALLTVRQGSEGAIALLRLAYVASFSTKLSDTVASEVGKVYGRRTFLITTLRPVPPGTEGAVSLEGTLAGIVGSLVIAGVAWAMGLIGLGAIGICLVAAFIATNAESVIGATLQARWRWLTNEVVNILNTAIGAGVALGLGGLLGSVWL